MERKQADPIEIERLGAGRLRAAVRDGDIKTGSVMAGQIAGLVCEIRSVKEIVDEIMSGVPGVIDQLKNRC